MRLRRQSVLHGNQLTMAVEVVYTVEIDKKGNGLKHLKVLASENLKTKHQFQLKL
jgi:hypothetical protein